MTSIEPQAAVPPSNSRFQYSLRTLLLLFVVLGSSLAVFGVWGIVVFAITVGLAICLNQLRSFGFLTCFVVVVLCLLGIGLLLPAIGTVHEPSLRIMCENNLRQIAVALQAYEQANGSFPPAFIADKNGKPIHSWRVLILPYLDGDDLYKAYDFTEPWDGPKNKKLLAARPVVYACPSDRNNRAPGAAQTNYVAVWPYLRPRTIGEGAAPCTTVMLGEVADSGILWTEPRDLSIDASRTSNAKLPALELSKLPLSSNHGPRSGFFLTYEHCCGAHVAMFDSDVHWLLPDGLSTEGPRISVNWPNIAALAVWLLSVGTLLTRAVRSRRTTLLSPCIAADHSNPSG